MKWPRFFASRTAFTAYIPECYNTEKANKCTGITMELADLVAYAKEKYAIAEEHKWADFPGFSVLTDPKSGKWAALLMRQWDTQTGIWIERCDMKCGKQSLREFPEAFLSAPFRMVGQKWIGVKFDRSTKPEVVCRLFDRAISCEESGKQWDKGGQGGFTIVLEDRRRPAHADYQETKLPIPAKIFQMRKLYEPGDNSFRQKCKNFFRQGMFMKDYEDDLPWQGEFRQYFPTYHDLNLLQLRGYFTWRTAVRRGNWKQISASMAYLYVYELLNGIGTDSPEESLRRLLDFEKNYLDSGIGDAVMKINLRKWMLEFSVLNALPPETALSCADKKMIEEDHALQILKEPEKYTDQEVFSALCLLGNARLAESPAAVKGGGEGIKLFARVWRYAVKFTVPQKASGMKGSPGAAKVADMFTACFGEKKSYPWNPLSSAVYLERQQRKDTVYELNGCRTFRCRDGVWTEECYRALYYDRTRLETLLHETDRRLRLYLGTGRALKEKPDAAWAAPFITTVLKAYDKEKAEAQKPKIHIDFSDLDRIRSEAAVTRDALLTEEETEGYTGEETIGSTEKGTAGLTGEDSIGSAEKEAAGYTGEDSSRSTEERTAGFTGEDSIGSTGEGEEENGSARGASQYLTPLQMQIVSVLLRGETADEILRKNLLMASVAADGINEALFDEFGDIVIDCDGDHLTLVDDYAQDLADLLDI